MDVRARWERLVVAAYTHAPERCRRVVLRRTTPSFRVGVLVLLRRPDGRVLLVEQPYLEGWALPGGNLARGESLVEGAARELREELGIVLALDEPRLAVLRTHDRWVSFIVSCSVGDDVADRVRSHSSEITRTGWFGLDDLPVVHPDSAEPLQLLVDQPT